MPRSPGTPKRSHRRRTPPPPSVYEISSVTPPTRWDINIATPLHLPTLTASPMFSQSTKVFGQSVTLQISYPGLQTPVTFRVYHRGTISLFAGDTPEIAATMAKRIVAAIASSGATPEDVRPVDLCSSISPSSISLPNFHFYVAGDFTPIIQEIEYAIGCVDSGLVSSVKCSKRCAFVKKRHGHIQISPGWTVYLDLSSVAQSPESSSLSLASLLIRKRSGLPKTMLHCDSLPGVSFSFQTYTTCFVSASLKRGANTRDFASQDSDAARVSALNAIKSLCISLKAPLV